MSDVTPKVNAQRYVAVAGVFSHYRINTDKKTVDVDTTTVSTRDRSGRLSVKSLVHVRISYRMRRKAKEFLVHGSRLATEVGFEMGLHQLIIVILASI